MANKNINILMRLTDQFTKPMLKATNATKAQTKAVQAAQQKTVSFVNKANNRFLGLAKGIGRATLAVTGLAGAFSIVGMKRFASEAMELANAQVEAETKLENALRNVDAIAAGGSKSIKAAKRELLDVASQIQKIGVIGDEVTIAGMQQLATYGLTEKQIAKLAPGLTDMLAQQKGLNASQEDAVNYAKALGRAMNGSTAGLSRYGVVMSEAEKKAFEMANQEERAVMLADMLQKRVGGVNAELAKTPAGQIQQTKNAWGDMMEELGKKLLPIKAQLYSFVGEYIPSIQAAATGLLDKLGPKIEQFLAYLKAHEGDIKAGLAEVKKVLMTVWNTALKPLLKFVVEHASTIVKVIAGIGAAFVGLNIVMKIVAIINTIRKVISIVRKVMAVIKMVRAAMAASSLAALGPIGLIVAAVAAFIVVLVLVIKNWDKIKAKVIEVANKIKAKLQPLINWIKSAWDTVRTKVQAVWDSIKTKIETVCNTIKEIVAKVKDAITTAFQKIKDVAGDIFSGPLESIKRLYSWVKSLIDKIKELLALFNSNDYKKANGGLSPSGLVPLGDATGTPYFPGGRTRINEMGRGEIVDLPNGTRIIPHDLAKQEVASGTTVNVNFTVAGNVIGNREFLEEAGDYIGRKVIGALGVV